MGGREGGQVSVQAGVNGRTCTKADNRDTASSVATCHQYYIQIIGLKYGKIKAIKKFLVILINILISTK